ncbi:MAG: Dps family protein [Culicoidibacterales bacterium]
MNSLYEEMNTFLADEIVLGMKIHNLHWYIKGHNFFTLHLKMDEYYQQAEIRIDGIAERLLMIGANPIGSLKDALARTSIIELESHPVNETKLVELLYTDFASQRRKVVHLIKLAEQSEDYGTADFFTGVLQNYEKDLWMLGAFLKQV